MFGNGQNVDVQLLIHLYKKTLHNTIPNQINSRHKAGSEHRLLQINFYLTPTSKA